ncbi:MAG: DUF1707 SHOCT-like domain-containing protein [Streptosporangiaceae bacterium]
MTGEMSPIGQDQNLPSADQLRASHEDRDRVIELLRVAAGDGRLTAEELDQRVEIAFSARTYGELAVLTRDLPATEPGSAAAPAGPPATPKNVIRLETRSGHVSRVGRWVVPRRLEVKVTSGHCKLDLTQAVISHRSLEIEAEVGSGHLLIVTRPGITVDTDDVAIRSGHVKVRAPWGHQVPETLRVTIGGRVGSGHIVARPARRSFWDWLRRRPRRHAITG